MINVAVIVRNPIYFDRYLVEYLIRNKVEFEHIKSNCIKLKEYNLQMVVKEQDLIGRNLISFPIMEMQDQTIGMKFQKI